MLNRLHISFPMLRKFFAAAAVLVLASLASLCCEAGRVGPSERAIAAGVLMVLVALDLCAMWFPPRRSAVR